MPTPLGTGMAAFGAGVGPCGHDPEDEPSEVVTQAPVAALYFDPFDRVYAVNDDLSMREGSGSIQRAAHCLLPLGSIPAVASSGLNTQAIRRASPLRRRRVIEDEVRVALKTLLDGGFIAVTKITIDGVPGASSWSGKFYVDVVDLITKKTATLDGNVT